MSNPFEDEPYIKAAREKPKKKTAKKAIIIGVIGAVLVAAIIVVVLLLTKEKHDFRTVDFGMTFAEVVEAEAGRGERLRMTDELEVYSVEDILYDVPSKIYYTFVNDKFEMIMVNCLGDETDDSYFNLYLAGLKSQYGENAQTYEEGEAIHLWNISEIEIILLYGEDTGTSLVISEASSEK